VYAWSGGLGLGPAASSSGTSDYLANPKRTWPSYSLTRACRLRGSWSSRTPRACLLRRPAGGDDVGGDSLRSGNTQGFSARSSSSPLIRQWGPWVCAVEGAFLHHEFMFALAGLVIGGVGCSGRFRPRLKQRYISVLVSEVRRPDPIPWHGRPRPLGESNAWRCFGERPVPYAEESAGGALAPGVF